MATHPFLSDEWIAAARAIYEEYRGKAQPVPHAIKANLVISDVPFGPGSIDAHIDTSSGELVMDTGHLEGADVKIGADWATAKAILIDQNPQAGMQAFMAGKVKIMDGDLGKLMQMVQGIGTPDPIAAEVAKRVQDITAS